MMIALFEQSLLFLPLSLGIYISYGVLRIPDLSTDGSFVLGAALFALSAHGGLDPILAISLSVVGGVLIGIITSSLQSYLKLNPLIAGILLVFILNTFTLKLMGRPNLSLLNHPSIFTNFPMLTILIPIAIALVIIVSYLLKTPMGLLLKAFGNNPTLLHLSGKNAHLYRMLGLAISNGLVAFCGSLTAQASGYADIGMGTGVVLIALGMVIIGEQFYHILFKNSPFKPLLQILSCLLGVLTYFSAMNLLISMGLDPIYLRLMTGVCLIAFLAATKKREPLMEAIT